ncbi:tRNA (guanosine(37)-N1)-methyltransferase TrmD [Acutalibacter intestini]|uniref:tRNA (guanosine(37)-N1)-methyltransferase TrmD n=1 Tax=Acutalibacter intestini TaxID=3093659 RepID=UPI002AC8AB47|nr:tRNA (guanosine(37)-N1)-methyltransferase TrmD [Acutalibacter sp. M00204]
MRVDIFTLFPEMFPPVMGNSIVGRARRKGFLQLCCHQLRDFSPDRRGRVDDMVFGGGKGMLLAAEPFARGLDALREHLGFLPHIIYMSPRGRVLDQQMAKELAKEPALVLLCGHYEGVDQRLLDEYHVQELSIGDYVLTGGELPAMILADAVSRMLPGVLSDQVCFTEESHFSGLLEYPQYTRPEVWRGRAVPAVLLSGHHGKIAAWRREEALSITSKNRPDLLGEVTKQNEQ